MTISANSPLAAMLNQAFAQGAARPYNAHNAYNSSKCAPQARSSAEARPASARNTPTVLVPNVNITESADAITLYVELPGVRKEDVTVNVSDERILSITGEKKNDVSAHVNATSANESDPTVPLTTLRSERRFGSFERSFKLGKHLDVSSISAVAENGVLALTLKKIEPKTIAVEVK